MTEPTMGGYMEMIRAELRANTLSGTNDEDVVDHIAKVLEILDLIKIPNVDPDQLRLYVFVISLSAGAFFDDEDGGPDYLDFINWMGSKFKNHRRMDRKTKNTLWEFWIKGGDKEILMYDIESSDDEWEESNNTNANADSFFKLI
uniref:SGNH hydrolase-type esterase domain-containing protein n=1 Tax=Tanacetum cinerariifolium TaxID=118510 RepID=A0A6L2P9V8_TANCI|nr:SGNH hydrolase-type esterase domain-containing protein [Tanacetum cinerariifolium]